MKTKQRWLAFLLSVMMVVTYMPSLAFAAAEDSADDGAPAAEAVQEEAEEAGDEATEEATEAEPAAEADDQAEAAAEEAEPAPAAKEAAEPAEEASRGKLVKSGMTSAKLGTEMPDSDELLEQFFDAEVDKALGKSAADTGKLKAKRVTRRSKLSEIDQYVYDELLEQMTAVAQGNASNTQFTLDVTGAVEQYLVDDSGYKAITSESLGIDDAVAYYVQTEDGDYTYELSDEAAAKLYDLGKVLDAVIIDNPASAYWFDGTQGYSYGDNAGYMSGETSNLYFDDAVTVSYSLPVAQAYRASADDEYTFDTAKAAALETAVAKVEQIIAENSGESDIDKLYAYKNAVCDLTSYNDDAAADDTTPYGDPWQMIYVFDGDESTTVVCEGYSKAFQYLCDRAEFDSSEIDCHTVSGTMGGGTGAGAHMWNILHMDDNRNYLADITNSDEGTVGQDGELFLKGYTSGSVEDGYDYSGTTYNYDDETLAQYSNSELKMSAYDYGEGGEEPSESTFSVELAEPIEIYEGTRGYPNEYDGKEYFVYNPDLYFMLCREGNKIIIDDVVYTYGYNEDEESTGFFDSEGNEFNIYDISYGHNQSYDNQWTVGTTNNITLYYNDETTEIPVTIVENPVKSIEFVPAEPIEIYENTNGYTSNESYWNEDTQSYEDVQFFRYYTDPWNFFYKEGNKFYVNDVEYEYGPDPSGEEEYFFYTSDGKKLDTSTGLNTRDDQSYDYQWSTTNQGTVTIEYMGQTCTVPVTIKENPVKSIRFEPANPIEIVENTNGYMTSYEIWDEETQDTVEVEYWWYEADRWDLLFKAGNKLYVNDVEYTYGYSESYDDYGFFNSDGEMISRDDVYADNDQAYDNQWTLDNPGTLTIKYMGQECTVLVTIVENPVHSVSYSTTREFIENKNGEWETDEEGEQYFDYYLGFYTGDIITVNGVDYKYRSKYDDFLATDGSKDKINAEDITFGDAQYSEHWLIPEGATSTTVAYYVEYMGHQAEVTATLKKNPVESIDFVPANEYIDRIFEVDGDWDEDVDGNSYFDYYSPRFTDGDKLIVHYNDGKEDATYVYNDWRFVNITDDNDYFYTDEEDGISIYADESEHWTLNGVYDTTVSYEGKTTAGPKIRIKENPIESITFSRDGASVIELTEGVDSEEDVDWIDNEDGEDERVEYERYYLDFKLGDRITVTTKDGTKEYVYREIKDGRYITQLFVNVNDDSKEITEDTDFLDEDYLYIDSEPEQSAASPWKVGQSDLKMVVTYYNREAKADVIIKANPVTDIRFESADGSDSFKLYEEVGGYWNDYYDDETEEDIDFYYYERPSFNVGDALYVTKDGGINKYVYTTRVFTGEYYTDGFVNASENASDDDYILANDIRDWGDNQVDPDAWVVGGSGYWFQLKALGHMFKVNAEVLENPVSEFGFSREGFDDEHPIELTEGLDARVNSDGGDNRWFEYYLDFKKGDTVTVKDKDGATTAYNAVPYNESDDYAMYFQNDAGEKIKLGDIWQSSDQSRSNAWQADGTTHAFNLEYFSRTDDVNVKIVKNPVQAISFNRPGSDSVEMFTEGDGYWSGSRFFYEINFKEGDELSVTYDGSSTPVKYVAKAASNGEVNEFVANGTVPTGAKSSINKYNLYYMHNVDWRVAEKPYVMLMYKGMYTDVPVTLVENPVESFEFVWAKGGDKLELAEGQDGYNVHYTDPDGGEINWFEYWLKYSVGDVLKVKFNSNDTPVSYVFTSDDNGGAFVASGSLPAGAPKKIFASDISQDTNQGEGREWKVGNDYEIKLGYLGKDFYVPVKIVKGVDPCEGGHTWDAGKVTKAATCEAAGVKTYTCTVCGETKTEEIPALGHKYGAWTSISDTEHQRVCSHDASHVEKAAHTWDGGKVTTPATEDAEGVMTYTCADCGATKTEAIPKLDHVHTLTATAAKAATCDAAGNSAYWTCSKCGAYFSDAEGKNQIAKDSWVIPALGHDFGAWTSISDTEHQRVCSHDATHVEKAAHTWDAGKVTKAATCDAAGVKTYTCTVCGGTKTEEIPALGHAFGSWTSISDTEHQRVCSHDASHVEKAAHTWGEGNVTKQPTCTEAGVRTYTCAACGATKTETIAALEHELKAVEAKDATFEADGNSAYWACSRCGKYFSDAEGKHEIAEGSWVIPKLTMEKALEQAEGQIGDADNKAADAEKAAETSTDENDAAEAEAAAARAVKLAEMAEDAAAKAYENNKAQYDNLVAKGADPALIEEAKANLDNAAENLAVAKQLVVAANSTVAKAKKAAAKIASNKAEAAKAAAAKAANSVAADEFRKEADAHAAKAAEIAGEAEAASAAAAETAGEIEQIAEDLAEKYGEAYAESEVAKKIADAKSGADTSAGAASEAAAAADTASGDAQASAADAKATVAEKARQGVYDKTIPQVKIKSPSSKKTTITAKWTKLTSKQQKKAKATKYEVWVCLNKKFKKADTKIVTVSKSKASATVKKLKKGKKYYVKVRAIKYVSGVKKVGKWSKIKAIKTKK